MEIDTLFSLSESKMIVDSPVNVIKAVEQPKNINLINSRREQNVAIILKRIRLSTEVIKASLIKCDDVTLSIETLQFLQKVIPTEEESLSLQKYYY